MGALESGAPPNRSKRVLTPNGRTKGWWPAEKAALIADDPWLAGLDVIDRRMKTAHSDEWFKARLLWIIKQLVAEVEEDSKRKGFDVRAASADDICDYALGVKTFQKLNIGIQQLNLSCRARNGLRRAGIKILADLLPRSEQNLLAIRLFGRTSLREVKRELERLGLRLGTPVPKNWSDYVVQGLGQ
jgi:hypothetical protein